MDSYHLNYYHCQTEDQAVSHGKFRPYSLPISFKITISLGTNTTFNIVGPRCIVGKSCSASSSGQRRNLRIVIELVTTSKTLRISLGISYDRIREGPSSIRSHQTVNLVDTAVMSAMTSWRRLYPIPLSLGREVMTEHHVVHAVLSSLYDGSRRPCSLFVGSSLFCRQQFFLAF